MRAERNPWNPLDPHIHPYTPGFNSKAKPIQFKKLQGASRREGQREERGAAIITTNPLAWQAYGIIITANLSPCLRTMTKLTFIMATVPVCPWAWGRGAWYVWAATHVWVTGTQARKRNVGRKNYVYPFSNRRAGKEGSRRRSATQLLLLCALRECRCVRVCSTPRDWWHCQFAV